MTQSEQMDRTADGRADRVRRTVALRELAVAPENLRFGEAADDAVPELAATMRAAGVMQPLTVRPGRGRKEAPWMALDGRRRLLALGLLAEAGEIDGGYEVEVFVETDPGRIAAAAVLTNTAAPVHIADVIVALGRMLKAKLTVEAIAASLGYAETDIRRLAALSALPSSVTDALRAGRLTLRQARLIARLSERKAQREIGRLALEGHGFQEWRVREALDEGRVTVEDPRFILVGPARYAAAGGRVESDLFGELPDRVLDPAVLTERWEARARQVADALGKDGLTAVIAAGDGPEAPEGLERFGYVRSYELGEADLEAYRAAREAHEAEVAGARALDPAGDGIVVALARVCRARAALSAAGAPGRTATLLVLRPDHDLGLEAVCYGPPLMVEPDAGGEGAAAAPLADGEPEPDYPAVDIEGISHAQHRARTEVTTHALARALVDDPRVALIGLTARLYTVLALNRHRARTESATTITIESARGPDGRTIEALNGEVERRLAERRAAQEASGLDPLPWIAGLTDTARLELLAELFATSIDLREDRTDRLRPRARAEARRLAWLCDADVSVHWTPDAEFLAAHGKPQLVAMLAAMEAPLGDAGALKKPELIARVAAEAAERRWVPEALRWSDPDATAGGTTLEDSGDVELAAAA